MRTSSRFESGDDVSIVPLLSWEARGLVCALVVTMGPLPFLNTGLDIGEAGKIGDEGRDPVKECCWRTAGLRPRAPLASFRFPMLLLRSLSTVSKGADFVISVWLGERMLLRCSIACDSSSSDKVRRIRL